MFGPSTNVVVCQAQTCQVWYVECWILFQHIDPRLVYEETFTTQHYDILKNIVYKEKPRTSMLLIVAVKQE